MEPKYELDTVTDEHGDNPLKYKLETGWEIIKTGVMVREEKIFFKTYTKVMKIYDLRRDITPINVDLNLKITIPKWKVDAKNLQAWELMGMISLIDEQLKEKGLQK